MSVGSEIRQLRADYNLTQAQLANVVGVTAQSVYYWERDEFQPAPHILECLAQMWNAKFDTHQREVVEKWIDDRLAIQGDQRTTPAKSNGGSALLAAAAGLGLGILLLKALTDDEPRKRKKRSKAPRKKR